LDIIWTLIGKIILSQFLIFFLLNTKRKAGIVLVAIILGLIISPAVPIEDSSLAHYQTNFKNTDQFYEKAETISTLDLRNTHNWQPGFYIEN